MKEGRMKDEKEEEKRKRSRVAAVCPFLLYPIPPLPLSPSLEESGRLLGMNHTC
jgi:hypothetical protein